MDRRCLSCRSLWALVALASVLTAAPGCQGLLVTAAYFIKGTDADAEYPGLKDKLVAVVCRPPSSMQFQDPRLARDLAQEVAKKLKERGSKIKIVDAAKIEGWCDANSWDEFHEVGKALGADVVVGIDIDQFELYQGQTLYQGRANASLVVQDCKAGGTTLFQKSLPQAIYPPNAVISTSEKPAAQFRREFMLVLADKIGRTFYAHDPYADLGLDAASL